MRLSTIRDHWFDFVWVALWGAISGAATIAASHHLSATFDEPFYLRAGLQHWRTGSSFELMRFGTMPLPVDVETFPVYAWERIRGRQFDLDAEFGQALSLARIGNQLFWFLLLAYGCRLARAVGGPWAGRLAVAALAVEPNLLAHAGLATTDVAIAACLFVFCFHYRMGRDGSWLPRVGIPAVCYGLAILAKASGLVFVPICVLAIEVERQWRLSQAADWRGRARDTIRGLIARSFLRDCFVMGALALILTYAWCGSDWLPHPKIVGFARGLPESAAKPTLVWLAEHFAIFNNAGVGLLYQIQHNMRGHGAFLMGSTTPAAFWYYFPVALSMKVAAPYLLAIPLLILFARRSMFNWACAASAMLLVFSINCRVQIGVRMQLPLIALGVVGLAAAINQVCAALAMRRRTIAAVVACSAIGWTAASEMRVWPDGLCYINELWGGPANGEWLLSDSNYDWGQGLKELDQWQRDRGIPEMAIWYFGADPASDKYPFRNVALQGREDVADEKALEPLVHGRYLAVGTTILYGSYVTEPAWLLDRLRSTEPTGRTRTFLIFDLNDISRKGESTRVNEAQFAHRIEQDKSGAAEPRPLDHP